MKRRTTLYERHVKRAIDVIVAAGLLVVTAPLQAAIAVGVLVNHGRPIVFRQRRITQGGNDFVMLKFKSMRNAPEQREGSAREGAFHTDHGDPRHTSFGRLIRRLSLDELPQLVNVLRGEMSIIGPRPELRDVCETYDLLEHPRHLVRPGLTGAWQVSATRHTFVHLNTHLDTEYVENLTFRRDLSIAIRTVGVLCVGKKRPRLDQEIAHELSAGHRSLRVMHVLEPKIAGVPAYVDQLGRLLAKRGIDQVVVTGADSDWPFEDWADEVVRVPWDRNVPRNTKEVGELIRERADNHSVDIVHAHSTYAGVAARMRAHPARVVYQPHGWGHLSIERKAVARAVKTIEKTLARRTDLLLSLSQHENESAPPTKRMADVKPLPKLERFTPPCSETRRALRAELGWGADEVVHLCVGEFSARKNQRDLVAEWLNSETTHRLALVGDGAVAPDVPPEMESKIIRLGWRDDVETVMQAADSLVVSSKGEGFSLVMLEALATGLPVFTTDVGGAEVVGPADGVVCASVREVVAAATESPLIPSSVAEREERADRHRIDPDGVAESFDHLYESLFQSRRQP